jgi:hypothetical protein
LAIAVRITVGITVGTVDGNAKRTLIARRVLIVCRTEIGNPGTDVGVWKGIEFGIQLTLILNCAVGLIQPRIGEIRRLTASGNRGG